MLEYSDTLNRLLEMRERFDAGFSSSDRLFISKVYETLFSHPIKNPGCSDCFRDAWLEIIHRLKQDKIMPKEKKFVLRRGVLLHAFNGEVFTNANISDEIAMDAINESRNRSKLFEKLPDNWEDQCKARKALKDKESATKQGVSREELQDSVESLKVALAAAQKDTEAAVAKLEAEEKKANDALLKVSEAEAKHAEAVKEIESLKAQLADKDREIEAARNENAEALKAKDEAIRELTEQKAALDKSIQEQATAAAKLEAEVDTLKNQLKDALAKAQASQKK